MLRVAAVRSSGTAVETPAPFSPDRELPEGLAQSLRLKLDRGTLDLPVLADAAQRVMRMALDDDVDPGALADTIKRDGAMASHLLRVANSPLYRGRAAIVSLQQAVSRLGMRKVREIALAIVCESRVFRVRGYDTEVREAFRHSLGAAYFAQEIARVKRSSVEEAFLAGLLHDIGRPVLLQAIVDLERELQVRAPHAAALAFAESHHESAGGMLVTAWELPPRVADAVRRHHAEPSAEAPLAAIVGLAHLLSDRTFGAPSTERSSAPGEAPQVVALNLYPEELDTILACTPRLKAAVEVTP
ncbi:MAG TPA: HDOD domain-containing protein [Polyangiaceae bacterium]|nr:HDOD domain-containing protein [Polyangiaceae bacterium]